jgi:hypothetical protein
MIENGEISPQKGADMLENLMEKESQEKAPKAFDQMSILNQIESGEISSEEGIRLLQGDQVDIGIVQPTSKSEKADSEFPKETPPNVTGEEMKKWKRWWSYPLYFGIGLTMLAAYWLNSAYQNSGYGFWFFCSWLPLIIGIILMAISWHSRTGTWLHVRVNSKHQRIAISIPAPLSLAAFIFRHFGQFIPYMVDTSLDEVIIALKDTAESGNPFYVHVDEGEDGEQVEVFIG